MFKFVNKLCMIHRPVTYEYTSVFTQTLLQRKYKVTFLLSPDMCKCKVQPNY